MNHTLFVEAAAGRYVLRGYRPRTRAWVEAEHAVLGHVAARGLPVPAPIATSGGETILERDGRFYALFPHMLGTQRPHGALTHDEIASAGAALGQIHALLRDVQIASITHRAYAVDRAATLAQIAELERVIRDRPPGEPGDQWALPFLAGQRRWLDDAPLPDLSGIAVLDRQVVHGDYQETNLLFAADPVCAILDWESTHVGPRLFEVLRAMDYMLDLDPPSCHVFLAGYRRHMAATPASLYEAAALHGVLRAHTTWLFQALYIEGNERLRQFVRPGGFVPFEHRWAAVKAHV